MTNKSEKENANDMIIENSLPIEPAESDFH